MYIGLGTERNTTQKIIQHTKGHQMLSKNNNSNVQCQKNIQIYSTMHREEVPG